MSAGRSGNRAFDILRHPFTEAQKGKPKYDCTKLSDTYCVMTVNQTEGIRQERKVRTLRVTMSAIRPPLFFMTPFSYRGCEGASTCPFFLLATCRVPPPASASARCCRARGSCK